MEKLALEKLYGESVYEEINEIVKELRVESNFEFDLEYIRTGCAFTNINAEKILNENKAKPELKSLVTQSFGEAAIFKFNC